MSVCVSRHVLKIAVQFAVTDLKASSEKTRIVRYTIIQFLILLKEAEQKSFSLTSLWLIKVTALNRY